MKKFLLLIFFFQVYFSFAQFSVRPGLEWIRTDESIYQQNYYHRYYAIGYDSLSSAKDGKELVLNGSFTEVDSLANPNPYRYRYEYDEAGRKTGYQLWKFVGAEKKFIINESISYYENGLIHFYKVLNRHDDRIHQDSVSPSYQDYFVYTDFDSIKLKKRDYLDSNGINISQYKYEYEYDSQKRISSKTYSQLIAGNWSSYYQEQYSYSSTNTIPDTLFFNGYRTMFFKDSAGKDTCHLKQKLMNQAWVNFFNETYSYDSLKRLILIESYDWDSNLTKWVISKMGFAIQWIYTNSGQLASFEKDHHSYDMGIFEQYTYFSDGRIKSYKYGAYDDIYNSWIYSHSYTYKKVEPSLGDTKFDFRIYPNPVREKISVEINLISDKPLHCQLYNSYGKKVREEITDAGPGNFTLEFSTEFLAAGIYLMSISDGTNRKTKKLIIKD